MRTLVAIALVATVLVLAPGLMEQFEAPKAAVVRTLGIGALAFVVVREWERLRRERQADGSPADSIDAGEPGGDRHLELVPLDWAVLAWLAVEALATMTSVSPRLSLFGDANQHEGLLTSLGLAGIYAATRLAVGGSGERDRARLLVVALIAVALACLHATLQAFGLDPAPWRGVAEVRQAGENFLRPFGTAGHPNLLGLLSAAALAAAIPLALTRSARWSWLIPSMLLFALATVLTLSRAAWIAVVTGSVTGATLGAIARFEPARARRVVLAIAGAALVAMVLVVAFGGEVVRHRLLELLSPAGGTSRTRWEIWKSAFAMWRERPWLGHGPDTFGLVYPRFQTPDVWRFEWGTSYVHAHSIFLHTLATRGALGVLAACGWLVAAIGAAVAAWRSRPAARGIIAGCVAALVAILVAGAFGALGIAGATWCVVLSAILASSSARADEVVLDAIATARSKGAAARGKRGRRGGPQPDAARGERQTSKPSPASRAATIAGVVAGLVVGAFSLADLMAARSAFEAFEWLPRGPNESIERSVTAARRAAGLGARNDQTLYSASQALLIASGSAPDPRPLVAEAEVLARRAIALEPARALDHQGLGSVLIERARLGDRAALDQAEAEFDQAFRLAPYNVLAPLQLATSELAVGRPAAAFELARHAVQVYPDHPLPLRIYATAALAARDTVAARGALATLLGSRDRGAAVPPDRIAPLLDSLATVAPPPAARGLR